MSLDVGIDIGGTFTDFMLVDEESGRRHAFKSPTTPADPSEGLMDGLAGLGEQLGYTLPELVARLRLIVHGTTVATNAILTGSGARTGLLTTEGFRDVLEMRRGVRSRKHLYDNKYVAPPPLVPRYRRLGVAERVDAEGRTVRPLDEDSLRRAVEELLAQDVDAIAVCFMHSYANSEHEQRARELLEELAGDRFLSISAEVCPQVRLYERVSTTAMNAYVGPVVARYLERLTGRLAEAGFGGALLVMQSNGGVATAETIAPLPVTTVLSGPAAGPVAAKAHTEAQGASDCVLVEMGGTSFDASLVKDGAVAVAQSGEVDRNAIAVPMTEIHTVGAGGGSVAWLDDGGLLRVGPQSAGADPGPAAYGRGGDRATVTDADLLLGYIDPDHFLGGRLRLHRDLAQDAVHRLIAEPLGLDVAEAAAGVYEVVNLKMAAGTKDMVIRRGYDPREFPLVVGGGAGPVHVGAIALELGVDVVVVPRLAAVLCAAGMLLADLRQDSVSSYGRPWQDSERASASRILDELVAGARQGLADAGVGEERQVAVVGADVRYVGQHHEVAVTFPRAALDGDDDPLAAAFHHRHEELYGFSLPESALEVMNLRATVLGRRDKFDVADGPSTNGKHPSPSKGSRQVWLPSAGEFADVEVFDGALIPPGGRIGGPAVVEEESTTLFVPEEFDLEVDRSGGFVMRRRQAGTR
jgi:N-methylhydantoinase A